MKANRRKPNHPSPSGTLPRGLACWERYVLLVLLVLFLALATVYNAVSTPFEAPDEVGHFYYVVHVLETGRLPVVPSSWARMTAWMRSRSASLVRILLTWVLTVPSLRKSAAAISVFEWPAPTSANTSRSREVSTSKRCRSGAGAASYWAKWSMSRRVVAGAMIASPARRCGSH